MGSFVIHARDFHDTNQSTIMPEVVECPHCLVTVLPASNDMCPSCSHRITDKPAIIRETISSTEESKMIGTIQMMYNVRKVLNVGIAVVAFNTILRYISENAERDSTKWTGFVVLLCIPLTILYTNYKIKRLRERLSKTTTR